MTRKRKPSPIQNQKRSQPSAAQTAYITLLSAADTVRTLFETIVAPFEITGQQYNVLRILRGAEPDGLPTLMIAERMIERTPGITRMIDRLEAKGLVGREVQRNDRRFVYCRITARGLELLRLLDQPVEAANHRVFCSLTKVELDQLTTLLMKTRQGHQSVHTGE